MSSSRTPKQSPVVVGIKGLMREDVLIDRRSTMTGTLNPLSPSHLPTPPPTSYRIKASVNVIAHEQVVGVWTVPTDEEKLQEVVELGVGGRAKRERERGNE